MLVIGDQFANIIIAKICNADIHPQSPVKIRSTNSPTLGV